MTCGEPARNCATVAVASWSRFNSCWGMHPSRHRSYLGCKQNLGHPVNDLFDLRTDGQQQAKHVESVPADGASEAVEKAFGQGIECGHGGSEHEHVSLPERADVVEIGKSYRPHSFRRCSEAGTSGRHAGNKADGEPD